MLDKAARAADDAAAEIRNRGKTVVSNMEAQASGLVGETGTAFRNVLSELMGDLDVILNKLEEMSNNARTSANKLSAQDQSSGASVRRVSGGGVTAGLT